MTNLDPHDPKRAADLLAQGLSAVDTPPPDLPQLEILEVLGKGGMGTVYKARQPGLDRLVALKVLAPELAEDPSFAERFQREARALARLDHPNIVKVYDFGSVEGVHYLQMEYVEGPSLRALLGEGKLSPAEALAIVPAMSRALQYAHDHGVVHRDVKPENVLLDAEGNVKIADFGLAKLAGMTPGVPTLTQKDQVLGTWHYMAPEQHKAPETVDHRADIYSLGVVFYEMLTGQLPQGRFEPPSETGDLDRRIDDIVLRALARERELRYQQVKEVGEDVGHLSEAAPAPDASRWGRVVPKVLLVLGVVVSPLVWPFMKLGMDYTAEDARVAMGTVGTILFGSAAGVGFLVAATGWGGVTTPDRKRRAVLQALLALALFLVAWSLAGIFRELWEAWLDT